MTIKADRVELNPNQTLRSAEAIRAVAMKTQAFARSARNPLRNLEMPYITPCRVSIRPIPCFVMWRSAAMSGWATLKFFLTK